MTQLHMHVISQVSKAAAAVRAGLAMIAMRFAPCIAAGISKISGVHAMHLCIEDGSLIACMACA